MFKMEDLNLKKCNQMRSFNKWCDDESAQKKMKPLDD